MDAGGFERLEEACSEAKRDAIAVPHLAPLAAGESKPVWIGELLAVEVGQQQSFGGIVVDVLARIDQAVACSVLQRNAPLPSRLARRRTRIRMERFGPRARNGNRPIARQPLAPVVIAGLERLLDQQSAESRA